VKSNNAVIVTAVALAVTIALMPELAFAQGGGAGAGQAQSLISWVVQSIGRPMLNGGIIFLAFCLLCARVSLGVVGMIAAGGLVFANYASIAGFFGF
jgi:hypothetical protein